MWALDEKRHEELEKKEHSKMTDEEWDEFSLMGLNYDYSNEHAEQQNQSEKWYLEEWKETLERYNEQHGEELGYCHIPPDIVIDIEENGNMHVYGEAHVGKMMLDSMVDKYGVLRLELKNGVRLNIRTRERKHEYPLRDGSVVEGWFSSSS